MIRMIRMEIPMVRMSDDGVKRFNFKESNVLAGVDGKWG